MRSQFFLFLFFPPPCPPFHLEWVGEQRVVDGYALRIWCDHHLETDPSLLLLLLRIDIQPILRKEEESGKTWKRTRRDEYAVTDVCLRFAAFEEIERRWLTWRKRIDPFVLQDQLTEITRAPPLILITSCSKRIRRERETRRHCNRAHISWILDTHKHQVKLPLSFSVYITWRLILVFVAANDMQVTGGRLETARQKFFSWRRMNRRRRKWANNGAMAEFNHFPFFHQIIGETLIWITRDWRDPPIAAEMMIETELRIKDWYSHRQLESKWIRKIKKKLQPGMGIWKQKILFVKTREMDRMTSGQERKEKKRTENLFRFFFKITRIAI